MLEDTTMLRRSIGLLVTLALGLLVAPLAAEVVECNCPLGLVRSKIHENLGLRRAVHTDCCR